MEFENEDFSVIVPDYLINENEAEENEAASEENEAEENEAASEENEAEENEAASEENEAEENEAEENEAASEIDYSSILLEMNSRLENIEANTVDYTEGINGLLANIYFIDFVAFTVFVFLMLGLVIKFFKQFF